MNKCQISSVFTYSAYSYRKAFTGLVLAALTEWKNTVARTTTAPTAKATRNTQKLIDTLKAKLLSHFVIK